MYITFVLLPSSRKVILIVLVPNIYVHVPESAKESIHMKKIDIEKLSSDSQIRTEIAQLI